MIVDLYAAVDRLLWALLAWIAIGAALGTVLLLGLSAAIAWIWRTVRAALGSRRGLSVRLPAEHASDDPRVPEAAERHTGPQPRRTPAWAHTQPLDHGEAA